MPGMIGSPAMKVALIRFVLVFVAVAAVAAVVDAQAPQAPNNGVQVAVPQGGTQDQSADTARQRQQQQARARLANQPAPRASDGHIILGNTATVKGVWIGGNLGFCNSNRVSGPASLNPGAVEAAQDRGAGPGAGRAAGPGFGGRGAAGPCTPIPYMPWALADRKSTRLNSSHVS